MMMMEKPVDQAQHQQLFCFHCAEQLKENYIILREECYLSKACYETICSAKDKIDSPLYHYYQFVKDRIKTCFQCRVFIDGLNVKVGYQQIGMELCQRCSGIDYQKEQRKKKRFKEMKIEEYQKPQNKEQIKMQKSEECQNKKSQEKPSIQYSFCVVCDKTLAIKSLKPCPNMEGFLICEECYIQNFLKEQIEPPKESLEELKGKLKEQQNIYAKMVRKYQKQELKPKISESQWQKMLQDEFGNDFEETFKPRIAPLKNIKFSPPKNERKPSIEFVQKSKPVRKVSQKFMSQYQLDQLFYPEESNKSQKKPQQKRKSQQKRALSPQKRKFPQVQGSTEINNLPIKKQVAKYKNICMQCQKVIVNEQGCSSGEEDIILCFYCFQMGSTLEKKERFAASMNAYLQARQEFYNHLQILKICNSTESKQVLNYFKQFVLQTVKKESAQIKELKHSVIPYNPKQCKLCMNDDSVMINLSCRHCFMCENCCDQQRKRIGKGVDEPMECPVCKKVGKYMRVVEPIYQ